MAPNNTEKKYIAQRTTQNISDALREIGELSSIFYLYYYFNKKGWSVYKNYDEKGYDILLFNKKTGKKIKIEIKTRQKLIGSLSNKNKNVHFTLTEVEKNAADYLIGLWYEYNMFFITPTSELKKMKSRNKKTYKLIVSMNEKNKLNSIGNRYLNNWKCINV